MGKQKRKPWAELGMSYFDWCVMRAETKAAKRKWSPWEMPAFRYQPSAKPEIRALVETVEGGSNVIWLSEGFPIDRSSYGRIRLRRFEKGEKR